MTTAGGRTALFVAALGGHALAVDWLLAAGAAVDLALDGGATSLFKAAQNGHDAVVARLLAVGTAVDKVNYNGASTPLGMASMNGHAAVVELLLPMWCTRACGTHHFRGQCRRAVQEEQLNCCERWVLAEAAQGGHAPVR